MSKTDGAHRDEVDLLDEGTNRLLVRVQNEGLAEDRLEVDTADAPGLSDIKGWPSSTFVESDVAAERLKRFSAELSKASSELDVDTASPQDLLNELTRVMRNAVRAANAADPDLIEAVVAINEEYPTADTQNIADADVER